MRVLKSLLQKLLAVFKPFRVWNDQIMQGIDALNEWKTTENPEDMKYFCLIPPTKSLFSKLVYYIILLYYYYIFRNTLTWYNKTGRFTHSDIKVLGKAKNNVTVHTT